MRAPGRRQDAVISTLHTLKTPVTTGFQPCRPARFSLLSAGPVRREQRLSDEQDHRGRAR